MNDVSHYENVIHPNEEKDERSVSDFSLIRPRAGSYLLGRTPVVTWANSPFVNWFVNFDEKKLRPWLIRNYSLENVEKQDNFDDAVSRTEAAFFKGEANFAEALQASMAFSTESLIIQNQGSIDYGYNAAAVDTSHDFKNRKLSLHVPPSSYNQLQ